MVARIGPKRQFSAGQMRRPPSRRSGSDRSWKRSADWRRTLAFEAVPDAGVHGNIDAAYYEKYDRYGPKIVGTVVGTERRRRHTATGTAKLTVNATPSI